MNKVYIVLVNYNNFTDTIECLESLLKSDYPDFQIFVVDNSADDSSIQHLSNWITGGGYRNIDTEFKGLVYPLEPKPIDHVIYNSSEFPKIEHHKHFITIIRTANNGFAAANNLVLSYLKKNNDSQSFIWILNNDTVIEKNTLSKSVAFYNTNAHNKYLLGVKLRYYDRPGIIQAIAGRYNKWLGSHQHIGEGEYDTGQYDNYQPGEMDYIIGASIFLPQAFLNEAGLLCEDYFLYFEELDWIKEGAKAGYKIAIEPQAIIYHKEGSSIIGNSGKERNLSIAEFYSITSRVKFIKKWYPWCLITVMMGVTLALFKRLLRGRFNFVIKTFFAIVKILFNNHRYPINFTGKL